MQPEQTVGTREYTTEEVTRLRYTLTRELAINSSAVTVFLALLFLLAQE